MRILVLGINYWPDETGIAPFTTGRCEYLAACGHEVTVLTGFPYYPQWRIRTRYRGMLLAREVRNGVTILRSWMYVPRRVTSARRVAHEMSFVAGALLRTFFRSIHPRPDLLYVISPPLGLGLVAALLSRLRKIPFAFHVADLQPDAAFDLGMLPAGRLGRILYRAERISYGSAALVSTLTETMRRRIIAKGVPAEKVALSPDWADPALFDGSAPDRMLAARRRFGLEDQTLVLHAGNMGVKQGLEVILGAAELAGDSAIVHLLVGDGSARPRLEKIAAGARLQNVRLVPLLPKDSFRDLLAAADICLVTQRRKVADIVFPSKMITLLAAGKPVIASVDSSSEVARVVTESGAGLVVEPENPDALRNAIAKLHADPEIRARMADSGRAYALANWNRNRILPATETLLARLGSRGPGFQQEHELAGAVAQPSAKAGESI